jgi:hypothetical protein
MPAFVFLRAEIVPCLGSCPQGQPGLLHLTLRFEKRTPPHSFVWERPLASSRTRDETSAGVVMQSSYGYICRKTRETGPYRANPVANRVHKDKK